jgi:hypothetical protein
LNSALALTAKHAPSLAHAACPAAIRHHPNKRTA